MTPLLSPSQSTIFSLLHSTKHRDLLDPSGSLKSLRNLHPGRVTRALAVHVGDLLQRPSPFYSEVRQTPFLIPPAQSLLQIPAYGLHLAFKASLHFLWLLLFPLSTYLVGFQDQPRLRLGYIEIEIDTVLLLFNLVKEKKKEKFLARVAPSKPGDLTKDPRSLDRK